MNELEVLRQDYISNPSLENGRLYADCLEDNRQYREADQLRAHLDEIEEKMTAPGTALGERVMIIEGKNKGRIGTITACYYGPNTTIPSLPIRDDFTYAIALPNVIAEEDNIKRQVAKEKGHIYVAVSRDAERVYVFGKYLMMVNK